jgi:hypothetical protein
MRKRKGKKLRIWEMRERNKMGRERKNVRIE